MLEVSAQRVGSSCAVGGASRRLYWYRRFDNNFFDVKANNELIGSAPEQIDFKADIVSARFETRALVRVEKSLLTFLTKITVSMFERLAHRSTILGEYFEGERLCFAIKIYLDALDGVGLLAGRCYSVSCSVIASNKAVPSYLLCMRKSSC